MAKRKKEILAKMAKINKQLDAIVASNVNLLKGKQYLKNINEEKKLNDKLSDLKFELELLNRF